MAVNKRYIVKKSDGSRLEITDRNKDAIKAKYMADRDSYELITEDNTTVEKKNPNQSTTIPQKAITPQTTGQPTGQVPISPTLAKVTGIQSPNVSVPTDGVVASASEQFASPSVLPDQNNQLPIDINTGVGEVPNTTTSSVADIVDFDLKSMGDNQIPYVPGILPETNGAEPIVANPQIPTYGNQVAESTMPTNQLEINEASRKALDFKTLMELDQDKDVFKNIMDGLSDKYSAEELAKGDYIEEAKKLFKEQAKFTDVNNIEDPSLSSSSKFNELILKPQKDKQKELGNVSIRKSLANNPDVFDQKAMMPDEIDQDYSNQLKEVYGDDVTNGEALFLSQDDFDMKRTMGKDYQDLSGDLFGSNYIENARDVYLKDAAKKSQAKILSDGFMLIGPPKNGVVDPLKNANEIDNYYREYMTQKTKKYMSPWNNDAYDKINELEKLVNKKASGKGSESDIQRIIELQNELANIQANPENQIYDPVDGKYHIKQNPELGPEAGMWNKEVDKFKELYSDLGISKMRKLLDEEILKHEELKRIDDKYSKRGVFTETSPLGTELSTSLQKIQSLTDLITYNYNPAKDKDSRPGISGGIGRGLFKGITGNDYKGDYEANKKDIELLQEAGMPINSEIEKYLTPTDAEELAQSIGGSIAAGGKIAIQIALGNKLKGFLGVPSLINKLSGGNKLKNTILTEAFDANMYGLAYEASGENYATGVGEYIGEGLGRKLAGKIKLNPDGLTSLMVEYGTGNITEMTAELAGELADRLVSGEGIDDGLANTLGLNDKEGMAGKLKNLAIHTMILSSAGAATKVPGILMTKLSSLKSKENKTQEDIDEIEIIEETLGDEDAVKKASNDILNNEETANKYAEVLDKKEEELSSEEKLLKANVDGIINNTPKEELAKTKVGEQLEIEFPEEAVQKKEVFTDSEQKENVNDVVSDEVIAGIEDKETEKIKVYRGEGANFGKKENEGFNWVAADKTVASNYAGIDNEGNVNTKEIEIDKPKNIFELPYKTNVDVKASNIGENIREIVRQKMNDGSISGEEVSSLLEEIGEWEKIAGENLEKYHTKLNKPGSSKKISDILSKLGYDAIMINETNSEGKLTPTYGLIKPKASTVTSTPTTTVASTVTLESEASKVKEGLAPISQKKVFDALIDYTQQVANETNLEGKELVKEVADRVNSNENIDISTEDVIASENELINFINKNKQNESKRINADKPRSNVEETIQSEKRDGVEAVGSVNRPDAKTDESSGRRIAGKGKEVAGESVTKDTEVEQVTPPPSSEMGGASVDVNKKSKSKVIIPRTIARRVAEGDLNQDEVNEIAEMASIDKENFKEIMKDSNHMIKTLGLESAYEYVQSPKTKTNKRLKAAVTTAKYVDVKRKLSNPDLNIKDRAKLKEEYQALLLERAFSTVEAARDLSFEGILQKEYDLSGDDLGVVEKIRAKIEKRLNEEIGGERISDKIEKVRSVLKRELSESLNGDINDLLNENEELKSKIDELLEKIRKSKVSNKQKRADLDSEIKKAKNKLKNAIKGKDNKTYASIPGVSYATNIIEAIGDMVVAYSKSGLYNTKQILNKLKKDIGETDLDIPTDDLKKIAMSFDEFKDMNTKEQAIIQKEFVKKVLGNKFDPKKSIEENIENKNIIGLWEAYQNEVVDNVKKAIAQLKKTAKGSGITYLDELSKHIEKNIKEKIKEVTPVIKNNKGVNRSKVDILSNLIKNQIDINNTFDKILESLDDADIKSYLENRINEDVLISNETIKGATSEFLKKELTTNNLFSIISDSIIKGQSYTEALTDRLINELGLSKAETMSVINTISDYMEINHGNKISEKLDRFIGDKLSKKINKDNILKIAERYFINPNVTSKTLADELIEDAKLGLSKSDANKIANFLSSEVSKFIKDKMNNELSKRLKETKEKTEEQKEIIKENQKLINKVQKIVVLGGLDNASFRNAFADKYGFKEVDAKMADEIQELYSDAVRYRDNGQTELFRKTQGKINTYLNNIKDKSKAKEVAEFLQSLDYSNVLSGFNTQLNAGFGGLAGTVFNGIAFTLRNLIYNPKSVFYGAKKAFSSVNRKAAISESVLAANTNFTRFDETEWTNAAAASNKGQNVFEQQVLKGAFHYFKNLSKEKSLPNNMKNLVMGVGQVLIQTSRMTFLLKAQDAFVRGFTSEYVQAVKSYNDEARSFGYSPITSMFMNNTPLQKTMDEKLGYKDVEKLRKDAKIELSNEYDNIVKRVDDKIDNGEISSINRQIEIDKRAKMLFGTSMYQAFKGALAGNEKSKSKYNGYINRRVKDMVENERPEDLMEFGNGLASNWLMMNEPETGIGMSITSLFRKMTSITDDTSPSGAFAKLATSFIIKFPRITGNTINTVLTNVPVFGLIPGTFTYAKNEKGTIRPVMRHKHNMEAFKQNLMTNAITTTLAYVVFESIFDYDEGDDEWKLDPNRLIDITSTGSGDYAKMKQSEKGWQGFAMRFRATPSSDWTEYKKMQYIPQMMGVTAILGRMSDDVKGFSKDPFTSQTLKDKGLSSSDQIWKYTSTTLETLMEGSFNSVGRQVKQVMYADDMIEGFGIMGESFLTTPIKNLSQPLFVRDVLNEVKSVQGMNKKNTRSWAERFANDFYYLDYFLTDKKDRHGQSIPRETFYDKWIDWNVEPNKLRDLDFAIPNTYIPELKVKETLSGVAGEKYKLDKEVSNDLDDYIKSRVGYHERKNYDKIQGLISNYNEAKTDADKEKQKDRFTKYMKKINEYARKDMKNYFLDKYSGSQKIERLRD
jgi:hypothetical protein